MQLRGIANCEYRATYRGTTLSGDRDSLASFVDSMKEARISLNAARQGDHPETTRTQERNKRNAITVLAQTPLLTLVDRVSRVRPCRTNATVFNIGITSLVGTIFHLFYPAVFFFLSFYRKFFISGLYIFRNTFFLSFIFYFSSFATEFVIALEIVIYPHCFFLFFY